jgi:hypothetical protein
LTSGSVSILLADFLMILIHPKVEESQGMKVDDFLMQLS